VAQVDAHTLIVMDAFALPVEGTETRVNAQAQAYEYMTNYTVLGEQTTRRDKVVGWYHSHPGYGCWLSGIDVETQQLNQNYQEPFVAVVVRFWVLPNLSIHRQVMNVYPTDKNYLVKYPVS
jgi:COP9 signalosome complex subunit 5